ncbi:hypothetical protein [Domibacillus robiginosus]|uniref:hypothetical protein n=1 Tax=Domibacillus robiginosus TaxID=1071054 RepID=UPI00067D3A2A|nr:hypothetical protein [Domibacillus robiginosus]
MKKQFKNQHRMLETFGHEFLVFCPNCNGQAKVFSLGEHSPHSIEITRRFLCMYCGLTKEVVPKRTSFFKHNIISYGNEWVEGSINIGGAFDWYFGYPLYLQTHCCGHTLWAYNQEHLQYLKSYIAAELRENQPYYLSVESRLPFWMKSAKNRNAVLKAIEKLEQKINK